MRWLLCLALALAAIWLAASWQASGQDDSLLAKPPSERVRPLRTRPQVPLMERSEQPKPPPIDGWIIVEVCSITGKLDHPFSEWAYIRPEVIVAITNPISTPENCVAITSDSGRRIYIQGTLEGIAALVTERIK